LKEKRWRAVQFSKAGLDVPEELSLFKQSGNQKVSENSIAVEKACPAKFVEPAKCEDHGIGYKNNMMKDSVIDMECQPVSDAIVSMPEPKTEEPCDNALVVATQKIQSITPNSTGAELDLQVIILRELFLAHFCILMIFRIFRGTLILHIRCLVI
jgi:ATP-dependent RNA helicase DHX37/DHR1